MSNEYVLASDVVAVLKLMHQEGYCIGNNEAMLRIFEELSNLKMVEAEPVVHAHWVPAPDVGDCCYRCSSCGKVIDHYCDEDDLYCARCGAHMDEEVADA